jgi:hypothetical protein
MIISIGPSTTLFTGFADDGDPTNGGPGTYSGGSPGGCTDAGANTYAEGPGVGAPQWYMLAGRANGQSGSKASHATKAQAVASVTQAFSVDPVKAMGMIGWALNLIDRTLTVTLDVNMVAKADLGTGVGDLVFTATIVGGPPMAALSIMQTLSHAYHVSMNPGGTAKIDVTRDGAPLPAINNPGILTDRFSGSFVLPEGSYVLDLMLDISDSFDGRVQLMGIASTRVAW